MKVRFHSIENARDFVNEVSKLECDVNLADGRIIVDAKSMMGVLQLDLKKSFDVYVVSKLVSDHDKLKEITAKYKDELP